MVNKKRLFQCVVRKFGINVTREEDGVLAHCPAFSDTAFVPCTSGEKKKWLEAEKKAERELSDFLYRKYYGLKRDIEKEGKILGKLLKEEFRLFEEALAPVYKNPKVEKRERALERLKEKGDILLRPISEIEEALGIEEVDDSGSSIYYKEESIEKFEKLREKTDRKVRSLLKTLPDFKKGKGFVPFNP